MLACHSIDEHPGSPSDASRPGLPRQIAAVSDQIDALRRSYSVAGEVVDPAVRELIGVLEAAKGSLGSTADLAMMLRRLMHAVRDSRDPHVQSVAAQTEVLLSVRGLDGSPLR